MSTSRDPDADPEAEGAAERQLKLAELRWKIRVAKADVAQKILISIIGAALVSIFYVFQADQTQSRYYSDLQAQRERADADLRANVFKTLFEAYFKNKMEAAQKAVEGGKAAAAHAEALLGQEIMLSDLLARNFETLDVRPLFEDVDRRLTDRIQRGGQAQAAAFFDREQLRRVAYGASARQTELLQANAGATVEQVKITQCGENSSPTPSTLPPLPGGAVGLITLVGDGSVTLSLIVPVKDARQLAASHDKKPFEAARLRQVPLNVTYFDMPSLENVRVTDGHRLALTLNRSGSSRACQRFSAQMDESARQDCTDMVDPLKSAGACSWAVLSIVTIPSDYISMRDRPYLDELSKRGGGLFNALLKPLKSR